MFEILIFHNQSDPTASWVATNLSQKLPNPDLVSLISLEELIYAKQWKHYLSTDSIETQIVLQSGKIIDSAHIKVVYNRIHMVSMPHFTNKTNRNYAELEMTALLLSFLKSLGSKVVNEPHVRGIGLIDMTDYFFLQKAAVFDIPVLEMAFSSNTKLFPVPIDQKVMDVVDNQHSFISLISGKPIRTQEEILEFQRVLMIGNVFIGNILTNIPTEKTRNFLYSLGCSIVEMSWVFTKKGWFLNNVNTLPTANSMEEIDKISIFILEKSLLD